VNPKKLGLRKQKPKKKKGKKKKGKKKASIRILVLARHVISQGLKLLPKRKKKVRRIP
jgi:hypothetical protein